MLYMLLNTQFHNIDSSSSFINQAFQTGLHIQGNPDMEINKTPTKAINPK